VQLRDYIQRNVAFSELPLNIKQNDDDDNDNDNNNNNNNNNGKILQYILAVKRSMLNEITP